MFKLHAVVCSTRPNRLGLPIAKWFVEQGKKHGKFDIQLIDLLEVNLPHMDEPNHPMLQKYTKDHTKAWSASVAAADAFVFVTPEYNYSAPPALLNAIDYLYMEWNYKPLGFVSYGGVSAGTRSVQMVKNIATAAKMMAIPEGVQIPFVQKLFNDGKFDPGDTQTTPLNKMLDELARWTGALKTLRG